MKLTKEELLEQVEALAETNYKVRALLKNFGGYDKIPEHQQGLIHKALGVEVKVTTEYILTDRK